VHDGLTVKPFDQLAGRRCVHVQCRILWRPWQGQRLPPIIRVALVAAVERRAVQGLTDARPILRRFRKIARADLLPGFAIARIAARVAVTVDELAKFGERHVTSHPVPKALALARRGPRHYP
jgi:hypothetical protein